MVLICIVVIVGCLIYMIVEYDRRQKNKTSKEHSYREVLPSYRNRYCEIIVKKPLINIDVPYSVKGVLTDIDDQWILLETEDRKRRSKKILRIENIEGIKELKETKD